MIRGERGGAQLRMACPHNGRRIARARSLACALTATVLLLGPISGTATAGPADTLGVYAGAGNPPGVTAFESRTGRSVARGHDFLDKRSWASMLDNSWLTTAWSGAGFTDRMVLSVPMLPDEGGTLAAGAAGDYNAYFRTIAERLVASGHPGIVLRLGPEFNGSWYSWTIDVPNGGPLYGAYWRQIVTTMRAVPGAQFKFDWAANAGSSWIAGGQQLDAADAWPGDAYVDYVGLDAYDQSWAPHRADPAARWHEYVNQRNGLRWHAEFAAAHGKPMTFPEWGLVDRIDGMGGGDAPFFIEQMYRWLATHPVDYHLYFESSDPNAEYGVFSGRFPNAAQTFVRYFGPNPPAQLPLPAPPPTPVQQVPPLSLAPPPPPAPAPASSPAPGSGQTTGSWPATSAGSGGGATSVSHGDVPVARGSSAQSGGLVAGSLGGSGPAKLSIARARIERRDARLDILAPISRLASGEATIVLHAAGRRTRFTEIVDSGRVRLRAPIPQAQAHAATGIVTITYRGNSSTQPQEVRLRAASQKAGLALARPSLKNGRLRAAGTISRRASGVVRTQLMYTHDGANVVREYSAPIRDGRWTLDVAIAPAVLEEIAARGGTVQANTLFTGYLPARIRGEMQSHQLLAAG